MNRLNWRIVWVLVLLSFIGSVHAIESDTDEALRFQFCSTMSELSKFIAEQRDMGTSYSTTMEISFEALEREGYEPIPFLIDYMHRIGVGIYSYREVPVDLIPGIIYSNCTRDI